MHTTLRPEPRIAASTAGARGAFDWAGQVRLGIVLSTAAAIVATGLGAFIDEAVLVVGSMVVASLLAWRRVDAHDIARSEVHLSRH